MIYFDNAATGGFKPRAVTDAADTVIRYLSANPGRSGHRLSLAGAKIVYECREFLGNLFGASPDRVIFTKNCTEALNIALFGTAKSGGHAITTVYEHNSVLRPMNALARKGTITFDVAEGSDIVRSIESLVKPETYMIAATAVSNVTGEELPVRRIGALAKKRGLLFIADGAQAGGHIPINLKKDNVDVLALAGHKGLYGIMGSGVLIFGDSVEINPLLYGGTGSESFNADQPSAYPERLEAGTLNLPAIAALAEGARYAEKNLENFGKHLLSATERLISSLSEIKNVNLYSSPNRAGIVSFALNNLPSADVADILNSEYDVAVRGGLHCAPLIHKYLNTRDEGLVRVSLAVQNSSREIEHFLRAVREIAER